MTGVLLAIDIVAIPLCLLAAWVAWRLRDDRRATGATAVVRTMAWAACGLLALRGLGTIQALLAPPADATTLTRLVDPFFLLGGLLFGLTARGANAAAAPFTADDAAPGDSRPAADSGQNVTTVERAATHPREHPR